MLTGTPKSQKTSSGLNDLLVNNRENGGRIGMDTLYSISRHFQRLN